MFLEVSYSIGREALINALAHSEGRNVELEISYDPKQFRLRVRDNGRGIGLLLQRENVVLTATRLCHPLSELGYGG